MRERLEQLLQIQRMCLTELKQAQTNCERYSSNMMILTENLNANWQDTKCSLTEFDSFITNITNIMDTTRRFNLHMQLYIMKLSEKYNVLSKRKKKEVKNAVGCSVTTYKETQNLIIPAEEYDLKLESAEDFVYPKLCLSEVYKVNDVINGTVTYIKNLKNLSFYMFDHSSEYRPAVVELSKSLELRQYHDDMPKTFEVFGFVLDNQIFRAVLGSKTLYDVEMNEEIVPCYILDTGEILSLKPDDIMYKLTHDHKNIPSLALPCQLVTGKNPFVSKNAMEDKLIEMEYRKFCFKVVAIENDTLHVEIMDNTNIKSDVTASENQALENHTLEMKSSKTNRSQLTEKELDMIYEEPLSTSNAMKAVMGYDPQDDKRICRFYDPSTGGCFKGVNCKLEHTFRQPDGWTKDILPSSSIMGTQYSLTIYAADTIINITPTYIGQLDRFFAQINEPCKNSYPLVWNDDDVPSWKLLQNPPHMFEIVLSRYTDGLWYRAKIVSHDDDYKIFKVFYVDYGNIQIVHLRNLASIDRSMAQLPFQAVLCRLESVTEKNIVDKERKNCIEMLCEMILNKSMDVKVISHYEDLFISFVDKKTYPLPDVLIEMGYLELNKNKSPINK